MIWKAIDKIEGFILIVGMMLMVFLNFANVVSRKLLPQSPFSYTEELVVIIFIWVSMFGISYAYRINAHTSLNLIFDKLSIGLKKAVVVFSSVCSVTLMAVIIKTGSDMVANQIKYGQVTPGMRLPMIVNSLAIPLGGIVAIFSIIRTTYLEIHELNKMNEDAERMSS